MTLKHAFVEGIADDPADVIAGKVVGSNWNADHVLVDTQYVTSTGAAGSYTLAKSGIVFKDGSNNEIFRIWGTDPNNANYNSQNLYIGYKSGNSQPTDNVSAGYQNIAIGADAMGAGAITGFQNVAIGSGALRFNTSGQWNFGMGAGTLNANTTGSYNVAVGHDCLATNVSGNNNAAYGLYSLFYATGDDNTGIGAGAISQITTGQRNTMVGGINHTDLLGAGYPAIKTGSDNTIIGWNAGPASVDTSNAIAIGSGVSVSASNTAVIGNASVTDVYFGSVGALANIHAANLSGGGTVTHTGALTANALVLGNGTDDIKVTTTGTGIVTALGVNVGSAGAPVLFNGAGGTPSSLTLTNATGLVEAGLTLANNTTADVSTTKHGFAPILPNDATKFLNGVGAYAVPAGGSGDYLGTLANAEISITSATALTISRQHVISGTSADYTVTLPAVSGNTGKFLSYRVANNATKLFTLDGNGAETIDGALTRVVWAGESGTLYCDGAGWFKCPGDKKIPMEATLTRATDQTGVSALTWTACTMTAQSTGPASMYDSGNGRIAIVRAGIYILFGEAYVVQTSGSLLSGYLGFGINSAAPPYTAAGMVVNSGSVQGLASRKVVLAAGDYVTLSTYQDATTAKFAGATLPQSLTVIEVPQW